MFTEEPSLAHYAKDKDNIVTTDAKKRFRDKIVAERSRWRIKTDSIQ